MEKRDKIKKEKHSARKTERFLVKRVVLIVIEIVLIGVMLFSGYNIFVWWKENNQSKEILDKISSKVTIVDNVDNVDNIEENKRPKYNIDFAGLKEENEDTVAWIKVENMNIEYPVVKSNNNEYYLTRSFDRTYNSAGWVFMDYRNKADGTDKNIVLYGHNRKDGSMFGDLKDIFKEEWYSNEDNTFITYITEDEYCTYEIFSAYRIEVEDYYITTKFKNDDEFDTFVKRLKKRSFRDFGVEVSGEDQILTLSTCSNADYRVAVHAKKIVEQNT